MTTLLNFHPESCNQIMRENKRCSMPARWSNLASKFSPYSTLSFQMIRPSSSKRNTITNIVNADGRSAIPSTKAWWKACVCNCTGNTFEMIHLVTGRACQVRQGRKCTGIWIYECCKFISRFLVVSLAYYKIRSYFLNMFKFPYSFSHCQRIGEYTRPCKLYQFINLKVKTSYQKILNITTK